MPGINPTALVVPPALEEDAPDIAGAVQNDTGASNVWSETANLIVTRFISG